MARQGEVFVIDGDDLITTEGKPGARGSAGPQTVPLSGVRSTAVDAGAQRNSGRAAGAASLSLWIWGSGQWLNGDRDLAMLLFLWQIQIVALHYMAASMWGTLRQVAHIFFISEWELLLYAATLDLWLIFLWIFNVSQAYRSAERQRGTFRGLHRPMLAGLASVMFPGWGQILNGQVRKGLFFSFSFVLQLYLIALYLFTPLYKLAAALDPNQALLHNLIQAGQLLLAVTVQMWLLSAYDAILVARYTRTRVRG